LLRLRSESLFSEGEEAEAEAAAAAATAAAAAAVDDDDDDDGGAAPRSGDEAPPGLALNSALWAGLAI
jgi:hypothetical protein